jgi:hypothetical protein
MPFELMALGIGITFAGLMVRPARDRRSPRASGALWKFSRVAAPALLVLAAVWKLVDVLN